jgi:hypothetical protein
MVAPIPAMERFALFCGFWALILFPTNVLLSPIILSLLPEPKNVQRILGVDAQGAGSHRVIYRLLATIGRLSHGSPRPFYSALALLVAVVFSVTQVLQIKVGNPVEGSNLLWEDSDYNQAVSQINPDFAGLNTLEIVFEAKESNNPSRVSRQADTVFSMLALQSALEQGESPPVATLSFADYLPEANRLFSGGHPKWSPLDNDQRAVTAAASAVMVGTGRRRFFTSRILCSRTQPSRSGTRTTSRKPSIWHCSRRARLVLRCGVSDHDAFTVRLGTGHHCTAAVDQ